jgi:hypothetical protein
MSDEGEITRPAELNGLNEKQLFDRLRPILRRGGLLHPPSQLERIKPLLVSTCWELGRQWQETRRLGTRRVSFREFLATKLCNELRAQDRKENPHLYDPHGKFLPQGEPLPLHEDLPQPHAAPVAADEKGAATASSLGRLAAALGAAGIAPASSTALLQHLTDMRAGKTTSPYKLARAQGLSTREARYQPASAVYTAIIDYIEWAATGPLPR